MTLVVRPLHPLLGGEVSGVHTGRPLDMAAGRGVVAGDRPLCGSRVPRPDLDDGRQMDFARQFGNWKSAQRPRRCKAPIAAGNVRHLQPRRAGSPPAPMTIRAASTSSATGCTPTGRSGADPRRAVDALRASRAAPGSALGGARPNSPICAAYDALPAAPRPRSRIWSPRMTSRGRAPSSASPSCCSARRMLPPVPQRLVRLHPGSAQDALPCRARLGNRRLARARRPPAVARPDRARHPTRVCLSPRMARGRSGHLGQPLHHAPRPRL